MFILATMAAPPAPTPPPAGTPGNFYVLFYYTNV